MKFTQLVVGCACALTVFVLMPSGAHAFCGFSETSATAKTGKRASALALKALRREAKQLKRQYGRKLVLDQPTIACKGGGVGIDANGNQITGNPSCTATQGFCVNP